MVPKRAMHSHSTMKSVWILIRWIQKKPADLNLYIFYKIYIRMKQIIEINNKMSNSLLFDLFHFDLSINEFKVLLKLHGI